ncbi:hypothetical protein Tco_0315150, partial [Tanacetum coccineum]
MLAISTAAKTVVFKALKPSFNVERVPQGTNPEAKPGHKKKKESSSAMDSNLSQTSASTPVVAKMYKEDQQATGGL